MLLTIICGLCMLLSILWFVFDRKYDWGTDIGSTVVMGLMGLWFIVNTIFLAVSPTSTISDIKQFEAVKITITQQRKNNLTEYERATLTQKIVEKNQWLAKEQFWAENIWLNWFYDKRILSIKPIE